MPCKHNSTCVIHCRQLAGALTSWRDSFICLFFTSMLQHFACFSLSAAKTCNLLNEKSLFLPKYSSGYNFLRTSGMVHPSHTSLFVSLLWQCQSSEGSFPQVAICVHCPGAPALHPELVFPTLLLQIHHGVLSSWLCSETVLEYTQDDFSTAAFNFWLWQSK